MNLRFVPVLRWAGRILALLLFLFWGSFFVEHTIEWFVRPLPRTPPLAVWWAHGLHLVLLLGLLALWRWERVASVVVIVAAFVFFVDKAGPRFPLFFGVTIVPALLVLAAAWRTPRSRFEAGPVEDGVGSR